MIDRIFVALFAIVLAAAAAGAGAQQDKQAPARAQAKSAPAVEYRPPTRGAPRVRVGGSTRSMARSLSLVVITPDHVGLSATEQPELFWYVSQPVKTPLEFSLMPVDGAEPLLEVPLAPVAQPGIQRIRLSELGARLKGGEEYQWTVSLFRDNRSRAKEAVASGRVRMQRPEAQVAGGYAGFARAGYWYDAMAELRRELEARPGDAELVAAQRSLLEQVGLAEIVR